MNVKREWGRSTEAVVIRASSKHIPQSRAGRRAGGSSLIHTKLGRVHFLSPLIRIDIDIDVDIPLGLGGSTYAIKKHMAAFW
jgi:hypothetical protein